MRSDYNLNYQPNLNPKNNFNFWLIILAIVMKPSNIKIIWHGEGPSHTLRELRHSYFSPYLFYINAKVIEASFQELRKHFDI